MAEPILYIREHMVVDGIQYTIYRENGTNNIFTEDGRSLDSILNKLESGKNGVLPVGGTANQILAKKSNEDFDIEWRNEIGSGGEVKKEDLSPEMQDAISKAELLQSDGTAPNSLLLGGKPASYYENLASSGYSSSDMSNQIYNGINLSEKFLSEISVAPYNGNAWAWIQNRIKTNDFSGLNVGDYISFTLANGEEILMDIAGIDTYYTYGDNSIPHHIDFISRDCPYNQTHAWNKYDTNNGNSSNSSPWMCSDFNAWINSLKAKVPSGLNNVTIDVDYTNSGIWNLLPQEVKSVIIPKEVRVPYRYSTGLNLTDDNFYGTQILGNLWIPFEQEIFGQNVFGSYNGYSVAGLNQYPLFNNNSKKIKRNGSGGEKIDYWLASARGGSTIGICRATPQGYGGYMRATSAYWPVICFRIA